MVDYARCNFAVLDYDNVTVVDGATVTVREEIPGKPLAALKGTRDGTGLGGTLSNPYVAADGADAGFFVAGGAYEITATKDGFSRTWSYVPVGTAQEYDVDAVVALAGGGGAPILAALPWIDRRVLTGDIPSRMTPTAIMLQAARAIKDIAILNGEPGESYFVAIVCNQDGTFDNQVFINRVSDGGNAVVLDPLDVDRSGGVTVVEWGSAPRVKLAINYSELPGTGVVFDSAASPLVIRPRPAHYVSSFFHTALDKLKAALDDPMHGVDATIAPGDSELWGAGASGASTYLPNTGALTDARNNFDAPSVANRFVKFLAQKVCNGEGFSTADPLSAAYPAGTLEYRKIFDVDVCYRPQFAVINTLTGLPVAKTITTEAGARLGRTLDLQPGQSLVFRHVGDWWKLIFTTQDDVSSAAVRPTVTLRGRLNAGLSNAVTTYEAAPTNENEENFYVGWDDWWVRIDNPALGAVLRIECIENHRALIARNNALYGTWSGQWLPGDARFDDGIAETSTIVLCGIGKNDRALDAISSTTGADNPTRTRENVRAIAVGIWANKPLADIILTVGGKAFGTSEKAGNPAVYGYSMDDVAAAIADVARELDLAFVNYFAVSAANDVPVLVSDGTIANGSKVVTGLSSTSVLRDGSMGVVGDGIPLATTFRVTGATSIELSANATLSDTVSLSFSPLRSADGLHANDAGHNDWYRALIAPLGVEPDDVPARNYAIVDSPTFLTGITAENTAAGAVATSLTLNAINTSSGETHTGKYTAQDNGAGTIRSLFQVPGPTNAGNKDQGRFDMMVEAGTKYMMRVESTAGVGYGVLSLFDRVSSGTAKVQLKAGADSLFTGGGINVSGGNVAVTGATGKLGYGTGVGGSATQSTSKSTGVTLNKSTGKITMNNAALAAGAVVSFTLTNSQIAATDGVEVLIVSGATAGAYSARVDAVASGSCQISLRNNSGGSLGEAVVLRFWVATSADS